MPKSAHGIAATLKAWEALVAQTEPAKASLGPILAANLRKQPKPHLEIRNGLCHGLIGASAGYHGQQASLHWELNGSTNRITWAEIQEAFTWLSKVPRAMTMIAGPTADHTRGCLRHTQENRSWWKDEFGINLQGAEKLERFAASGGGPL